MEVFDTEEEKFPWLKTRVAAMLSKGQVVVFAKSKQAAQEIRGWGWLGGSAVLTIAAIERVFFEIGGLQHGSNQFSHTVGLM